MQQATFQTADGTIPIRSYRMPLPPGDAGVRATVRLMLAKVNGSEGDSHPGVRAWAIQQTRNAPDRDDWAQACALFRAVKRNIRFLGEKDETVQTPWLTLQLGAGDCDDHTTLLVALLRSLGIPARIQTIATDPSGNFTHVFAMAGIRSRGQLQEWRALDPTVTSSVPGWQPPHPTRRQMWSDNEYMRGVAQPGMQGFFSTLFRGSLKAGKIALAAGEGAATGGPAGAVVAGAGAVAGAVKGKPKGAPVAAQMAPPPAPGDSPVMGVPAKYVAGYAAFLILVLAIGRR